ncbi:MAG: apolipoprotein N-acyltransferase [Planctomycetota bacterium]|nr:apolipoprotein N-acyltransferase [Planctomycetota bacterium]
MSTQTVAQSPPANSQSTQPTRRPVDLEPTIQDIIRRARSQPVLAPARGALGLSVVTAVAMWASFAPLDIGPLAWICLVPLVCLIRIPKRTRWMYPMLTFGGFGFSLSALQWMRLGDASMYTAWFALAVYVSLYFPMFVVLARTAVQRYDVPITLAVPVLWVGLEFCRSHLMTGFPWYYLAHTQYRWIELIQISDITGAYGVSFLVAMSSACIGVWIPTGWLVRMKLYPPGATAQGNDKQPKIDRAVAGKASASKLDRRVIASVISATLVCAAVVYGIVRRNSTEFQVGPRIALIQANFPPSVKHDPASAFEILHRHDRLSMLSMKYSPDVIIWPETMFPWPMNEVDPNLTTAELDALMPANYASGKESWRKFWTDGEPQKRMYDDAIKYNAATIMGVLAQVITTDGVKSYNSSVFVKPQTGIAGRYDKRHRVPFGEYVPLKDEMPFLAGFTPFSADFGIAKGEGLSVFDYNGWRFASIICYEDTIPHLVRRIALSCERDEAKPKPVDVLVNQTNDAWFRGSAELDQHLITSVFRAVECRTPLVRAVNGGISSIVDGDGVIVEPEVMESLENRREAKATTFLDEHGGRRRELDAVLVHPVPLDPRSSLYVHWGDWFAMTCCLLTLAIAAGFFVSLRGTNTHRLASSVADA